MANLPQAMLAFAVLLLIPGPDMALVSKVCMTRSPRSAEAVGGGIALGLTIHVTLACWAGNWLMGQPGLRTAVTLLGALFLLWLGINSFIAAGRKESHDRGSEINRPGGVPFLMGFFSNISNPKVFVFFFSLFLSLFSGNSSAGESVIFAFVIAGEALIFYLLLIRFLSGAGVQRRLGARRRAVEVISGMIFIALSVNAIVSVLPEIRIHELI